MSSPTSDVTTCPDCGAQVADQTKHTAWHDEVITEAKLADVIDQMTP